MELKNIKEIANKLKFHEEDIIPYGKFIAKIACKPSKQKGKLVLVTAINPTPSGEGKTTVSIGLADAFNLKGESVCLALREPSLGPVFGMKGGATGGGLSRIEPSKSIDLHFTGDIHAITSANNLLCAMIDNHIYFGNELGFDKVTFNRCMDMNDRALRNIVCGSEGCRREEKFNITASSEIMAILCLAKDMEDLKRRLGNIVVGLTKSNQPIYAKQLKAEDAMCVLLFDAIKPNLVQTLIGTPAIVHGGPFANIAHGCNSIIATNTALGCASYVITEAGFGADLGAEKFFDVKCRKANLKPDAVVLVCTIKALKYNGGVEVKDLQAPNVDAVVKGSVNLIKHIKNIKEVYKLPLVVAINRFASDSEEEIEVVKNIVNKFDVDCEAVDVFGQGGQGALGLVDRVIKACDSKNEFTFAYQDEDDIVTKCTKVACKIYGASGVELTEEAKKDLEYIQGLGKAHYPVVIAKTQYSLSDAPKALGAPSDFKLKIRAFELRNGAEFIVAIAGDIMLMPGLSREPRATKMLCNQDDFNLA